MNSNIKPNLFIVGAPRCGTTTLYHYLRQHPNIFMSGYKEPHYFGKDLRKNKKLYFTNKEKYLDLFTKGLGKKAIGEASSYYLFSSLAPKEIFQFNPRAKIIILLRQPTELLYSYHSQLLYLGDECEKDFYKALNLENCRKKGKHLPDQIVAVEILNLLRPIVAVARYMTFNLKALEDYPSYKHIHAGNTHGLIKDDKQFVFTSQGEGILFLDQKFELVDRIELKNALRPHGVRKYQDIWNLSLVINMH